MHSPFAGGVGLLLGLALFPGAAAEPQAGRELIQDNQFRRGLILWQPKPGKHVRYGELRGSEAKASPVYDNRHRHSPEHKSKDFGGTEKFIFTPDARTRPQKRGGKPKEALKGSNPLNGSVL